ncbi:MAG: OmpA family protein, partial [Candidatus Kapaibacteriota bacterium]
TQHGNANAAPQQNIMKFDTVRSATSPATLQSSEPQTPNVKQEEAVEEVIEDSWLDEEESEEPNQKKSDIDETEEVEDPPFDEAEDPLSENMANVQINAVSGKSIGKTYKLRKVFFDYDNAAIKEESKEELNVLYSYLDKNPDLCVRLNAHTDSDGSNDYNLNLSQKRAQSVMDFLVSKGIDPIRLSAQGFGEELPISSNDTPEGREQNRRVEFTQIGC